MYEHSLLVSWALGLRPELITGNEINEKTESQLYLECERSGATNSAQQQQFQSGIKQTQTVQQIKIG